MPAGIINTGTHPRLLWPGIHAIWGQQYAEHAEEYTQLYEVLDSDKAYEVMVQVTGFPLAVQKPETQGISYVGEVQGGVTNFVHIAYALGYIVSHEEIKDNLYSEVSARRARANAFSMRQTVENVAAFMYNTAFVSTYYAAYDGRPIIDTQHVNAQGGTWSNKLSPSAALAETSLEDACIQIMGMQNDTGLQINVMPQSLHVHRSEFFNAHRILGSTLQSGSSNNDINVLKTVNAFPKGVHVNHYFTAPRAWFIRTNTPNGPTLFWRERPSFDQDNDFDTKNAKAASYMRLSVGIGDPRGLLGSEAP